MAWMCAVCLGHHQLRRRCIPHVQFELGRDQQKRRHRLHRLRELPNDEYGRWQLARRSSVV